MVLSVQVSSVCARGAGMDCAGVGCLVWAGLLRIYICESEY